jgi:hypothetical protein
MSLAELARHALLGARNGAAPTSAAGHPEADILAARLSLPEAPAATLLRQAALLTLGERAGYVPERPNLPPAEPCPEDATPVLPERAAAIVQRVLAGFLPQLAGPLLDETARRGFRLPAGLLPALLELGRKTEHRQRVLAVACRRTYWLALQNPGWRYLADPEQAERVFETGKPAERCQALRQLRKADPAAARERLESGWAQEPPNERAGLIEALEEGLSGADEEFLENALDDRRKEVRKAAAALLACLPDSRLAARMRERVSVCLRLDSSGRTPKLDVELPAECGKAMERDGVEKKIDIRGLGERAAWLAQMLACVPPSEWRRRLGLPEVQLLEFFRKHEFGAALHFGLALAIGNFRDSGFAKEWLAAAVERGKWRPELFEGVAEVLRGTGELEAIAIHALQKDRMDAVQALLPLLPTPWSEAVGAACLDLWRNPARYLKADPYGYGLRAQLALALAHLPPRPDCLQGWESLTAAAYPAVRQAVEEFIQAMELRIQFNQALETS